MVGTLPAFEQRLRRLARNQREPYPHCYDQPGAPSFLPGAESPGKTDFKTRSTDAIGNVFSELFCARNARDLVRQGSSLLLAMVRQIVEMSHGTIELDRKKDKSSVFHIVLPKKARRGRTDDVRTQHNEICHVGYRVH